MSARAALSAVIATAIFWALVVGAGEALKRNPQALDDMPATQHGGS